MLLATKTNGWGRSQDGGVGRQWVSVSAQLGCLPATGGRPWHPRRWEKRPSEQVGRGGTEGEEKWRPDRIHAPDPEEIRRGRQAGPSRRSRRGAESDRSPSPLGLGSLLSSQASPLPSKAPSRLPGRKAGEIRRGTWEGPSGTRGAGEERRVFALPTGAQEACWAPKSGRLPSETTGGYAWAPSVPWS